MTYVDVTLTPAATYTYVHNGQIYDQIATTLTAHSNWQYVEYVDAISAPNTYRRHVWRCKSAGSGLPSDFYVMFQTKFTTATGVYDTVQPVYLALAEVYSGGVMSKLATTEVSVTPASDLTNPTTWTLSTFGSPAGVSFSGTGNRGVVVGTITNSTSLRLLYIVAKDGIMTNWGTNHNTVSPNMVMPSYVGAYDTLLGAADPMPIVSFSNTANNAFVPCGCTTRAVTQTAGVAVTDVFGITHKWFPADGNNLVGRANARGVSTGGTLGLPSDPAWTKSDGGVQMARAYLSSFNANVSSTNSTKGFVRGYAKYVRVVCGSGGVASHSAGDTFLVDGKVHLGLSNYVYGLWDTTAT